MFKKELNEHLYSVYLSVTALFCCVAVCPLSVSVQCVHVCVCGVFSGSLFYQQAVETFLWCFFSFQSVVSLVLPKNVFWCQSCFRAAAGSVQRSWRQHVLQHHTSQVVLHRNTAHAAFRSCGKDSMSSACDWLHHQGSEDGSCLSFSASHWLVLPHSAVSKPNEHRVYEKQCYLANKPLSVSLIKSVTWTLVLHIWAPMLPAASVFVETSYYLKSMSGLSVPLDTFSLLLLVMILSLIWMENNIYKSSHVTWTHHKGASTSEEVIPCENRSGNIGKLKKNKE